ncbi:MAG: hypothetical protein ACLFTL_10575, partial [Alphaproteobacteria bacterium]
MRRLIAIRRGLTRQESEPIGTGRVDAGIGPLVADVGTRAAGVRIAFDTNLRRRPPGGSRDSQGPAGRGAQDRRHRAR